MAKDDELRDHTWNKMTNDDVMFPYCLASICLYLAVIHLKTDYHFFVASAFNSLAVLPPCLRSSSTYTGGKPISTFFCAMSSGVRCL